MRVTTNTFPTTLIEQLSQLAERQNRLQSQAASGQRIQLPEDDPTSMRRVLDMQSEARSLGQYGENIDRLKEQSTATYDVIRELKNISDRAGEIAVLADGTRSQEELNAYAAEIGQLIHQGVQMANSKHRGDYLLSGTAATTAPFSATLDASGNVTAVTYAGNTSVTENEIGAGVQMSVQAIGANTSGAGARGVVTDTRAGADFFNHLITLHQHLLSGNTNAIAATDRADLAKDEDNFLYQFGTVGAIQARLDTASTIAKSRGASIEKLISGEVDSDLAQTIVKLTETQNAYTAALQSGATILNQSLLDFLS